MQILGGLVGTLFGAIFGGKKAAPPVAPLPTVSRDDAASSTSDALARRQGAAADMLTGSRGAEAASGTTGKLVIGN